MSNKQTSFKIGRSAITGRFEPVSKARQHPSTSVVQTIKKQPSKKK